jgi:PhzF family phenazine biosynthesis protein
MIVHHIAAFTDGPNGGNPAGVVLCEALPDAGTMQVTAAKVGYSETVFAAPVEKGWRVRYFAPEVEVDFCGHATIARRRGHGVPCSLHVELAEQAGAPVRVSGSVRSIHDVAAL